MKYSIFLVTAAGLILLFLSAGCTSPTQVQITPTETPTTFPTTLPPAPETTVTATPEAVATLPAEQFVDIRVTKERPDASIHILYNGGKGDIALESILVVVTRSDGQVIQQYMNDNTRKPRQGDELIIPGTRGVDQVQVYVMSANRVYKIIDEPLVISYI